MDELCSAFYFACAVGEKYSRIQYHALLAKRNASFAKNAKSALIAMGFEQFNGFAHFNFPKSRNSRN